MEHISQNTQNHLESKPFWNVSLISYTVVMDNAVEINFSLGNV
jgi:hypothetical protein